MKIKPADVYNPADVDPRPGNYYVSVVDGSQFGLLLGPFPAHQGALAMVDACREYANEIDRRAWFYAFGTCRMPEDFTRAGLFNEHFKMEVLP